MSNRVCPWWLGYFLLSPLRRWRHDPATLLAPLVKEGMTVLEPGPGMGFFTLELARLVGPRGRVVVVDVEPRMLAGLARRARRVGLAERIESRLAAADGLGTSDLAAAVDFVLAFAVVHELPNAAGFFAEARRALKSGGRMLVAEPTHHVSAADFAHTVGLAEAAGFAVESRPSIGSSLAVLLRRR